jgi:hypothetical protein
VKPGGFEQSAHRKDHAAIVFDYCDGAHPRLVRRCRSSVQAKASRGNQ